MAPRVSVIVPARDAAATLPRTLAALDAQRGAPEFEVRVVDDAAGEGPGRARNAGVAATSAPLRARSTGSPV